MQYNQAVSASRKVTPDHLNRRAVVYVRQSSYGQVLRNTGSTQFQYGLAGVAAHIPEDRQAPFVPHWQRDFG